MIIEIAKRFPWRHIQDVWNACHTIVLVIFTWTSFLWNLQILLHILRNTRFYQAWQITQYVFLYHNGDHRQVGSMSTDYSVLRHKANIWHYEFVEALAMSLELRKSRQAKKPIKKQKMKVTIYDSYSKQCLYLKHPSENAYKKTSHIKAAKIRNTNIR